MATPITKATHLKQKPADESKLGFGKLFTDHMLLMDYQEGRGWYDLRIVPYSPFSFDPATSVFHYGQAIFEGLKAYRDDKGGVRLFRPMENVLRFNRSAERMCIPQMPEEAVLQGIKDLVLLEKDWIPQAPDTSMYIRPTIIATDPVLGVKASSTYLFFVILSPSGAYYASGLSPIKIHVEDEYVRAVRGGIGFTKAAANYACSLKAGEDAKHKGYTQVLWLDGVEQKYIEEVGSMNMFFKIGGKIVTPALNGSILPGITRDSILKMAAHMGYPVEERRLSLEEVVAAHQNGTLEEAFGSGTAAVVSPVGWLGVHGRELAIGNGIGPVTQKLYDALTALQYGRGADPFGWSVTL